MKKSYFFKRGIAVAAAVTLCLGAFGSAASAEQNTDETAQSSAFDKDNLADGKYTLTAEMIKTDRQSYSMSNDAIGHTVQLDVENGEYYITMQFKGLAIYNMFGYLQNLSYYDAGYSYNSYGKIVGTRIDSEVVSTQKNSDGTDVIDMYNDAEHLYPELVKFKLVDKASEEFVPLHVFVPIMESISDGTGDQDVLMRLDWTALAKTEDDIQPETTPTQSAAVDLTDSATGVKVHADAGVFDSGVELVVSKASVADGVLADVAKSFTAYTIGFKNADGSTATPNGRVTLYLPMGSLTADTAALYKINDDGSKTLVKGTVEGSYFTAVQKSVGTYALVEAFTEASGIQSSTAPLSTVSSGDNGTASSLKTTSTSSVQTGFDGSAVAVSICAAAVGAAVFACALRKKKNSTGE